MYLYEITDVTTGEVVYHFTDKPSTMWGGKKVSKRQRFMQIGSVKALRKTMWSFPAYGEMGTEVLDFFTSNEPATDGEISEPITCYYIKVRAPKELSSPLASEEERMQNKKDDDYDHLRDSLIAAHERNTVLERRCAEQEAEIDAAMQEGAKMRQWYDAAVQKDVPDRALAVDVDRLERRIRALETRQHVMDTA